MVEKPQGRGAGHVEAGLLVSDFEPQPAPGEFKMAMRRKALTTEEGGIFDACGKAAAMISRPDFHKHLLDAVGELVEHDIRSMMRYSRFSAPDFLANDSYTDEFVAHYETEFYRYDPYYRYWKENERPGIVPLRRVLSGKASRNRYVNVALTEAGITDEISVFLPPVGGSSLALFFDRRAGRFRESEIARLERAYPLIAGLHQAHVTCLMAGSCDLEDETGVALPKARPIRILDRAKQEVFQNAAWQRLNKTDAKGLAAALAKLPRSGSGQASLAPGLILHRAPLSPAFGLAPGGMIDTVEDVGMAPAAPGQPGLPPNLARHLTPREQEIVELILQGYPTKSIADKLRLSRGTIKNYRQRLYDKLDITTEREIFLAFIAATKQR
jgi:DNA-binding CsgD family transcriptional regulator